MLIPHVVQTEADKVFVNILNNQTVSVTDGDAVVWNTSTPDGVRTTQAAANTLALFVGLADGTIAASGYGLAQAYGYKATCSVTAGTSVAIVAGDALMPVSGADTLQRSHSGGVGYGFCFTCEAYATDSTPVAANKKVLIRAL